MTLPITDQRGILRGTSVDIGAYQVGYGYLVTNTADSYGRERCDRPSPGPT